MSWDCENLPVELRIFKRDIHGGSSCEAEADGDAGEAVAAASDVLPRPGEDVSRCFKMGRQGRTQVEFGDS